MESVLTLGGVRIELNHRTTSWYSEELENWLVWDQPIYVVIKVKTLKPRSLVSEML